MQPCGGGGDGGGGVGGGEGGGGKGGGSEGGGSEGGGSEGGGNEGEIAGATVAGEGEIAGAAAALDTKKPTSMIPGSMNCRDAMLLSRQYRDGPAGWIRGYGVGFISFRPFKALKVSTWV